MHAKNWLRIVLCGWVTGVVYFLLTALSIGLFAQGSIAQELLDVMEGGGPHTRWGGGVFFGIDLMMGIWAMWLYSVIAPRYGAGPKTAAVVGLAWWTMKSLQSAKWAGLGFLALDVGLLLPLVTTLVCILVASVIGAGLYEKVEFPQRKVV